MSSNNVYRYEQLVQPMGWAVAVKYVEELNSMQVEDNQLSLTQ